MRGPPSNSCGGRSIGARCETISGRTHAAPSEYTVGTLAYKTQRKLVRKRFSAHPATRQKPVESLGPPPESPRNRILASLPWAEYESLRPELELITLDVRDLVYDIGRPIDRVLFVETGVISIISVMADGSSVEAATVGYEGMVGLPVYLDTDRSATQAFCQVPGKSLSIPADAFRRVVKERTRLRSTLNRYAQALFTQVAQASACNRLHPVRERCARWLLQTHDRVDGDE